MNDLQQGGDFNHGLRHGFRGNDRLPLDALLDGDGAAGQILVWSAAARDWVRYDLTVPAANQRNGLFVDNGETTPTWQSLYDDTTTITTIDPSDAAVDGTNIHAARVDHQHAAPATYPATAHNLLSATHGDTTAASPARGDFVAAIGGTSWTKLAVGASNTVVVGGTDPSYSSTPALATLTTTGKVTVGDELEIDGALNHDGTTLGVFGTAPATKNAVAALTNNITSGGTANTLTNYNDLNTYNLDSVAIRNNLYQLGLKVQDIRNTLANYGFL